MRLLTPASVGAALLLGVVAAIPFHPAGDRAATDHALALTVTTIRAGHIQLFYDNGAGHREQDSVQLPLPPASIATELQFNLPPRRYVGFRLDPMRGDGAVTFSEPKVVTQGNRVVRQLRLESFVPAWDIAHSAIANGQLRVEPKPGAIDPQIIIQLDSPLDLRPTADETVAHYLTYVLAFATPVIGLLAFVQWVPGARARARRARDWCMQHPQSTVVLVAALAAIISNYPVIFLGRSYTSPNLVGPLLLYEAHPTLPGYSDTELEDPMGSDVGAIAWHHHPLSILQHRALFHDRELPLWNRYDSAGVPLLGQGQSMFGDPLHLLPVMANGAAWAWDAKYVLARWLFACSLGLIVWRLTRHAPAATLTALSSAFIGFFLFRVNHPAQFSVCYAPLILLAWTGLMQASGRRWTVLWVGALVAACGSEINSGTAKEAYMLLIGMNLTGLLLVLCSATDWVSKLRLIAWAGTAGLVFVCVSAPVWMTFLDALGKSYTSYNNPMALQILPTFILGLFDELFYRPFHANEYVWNPSANFLVLGGVLYLLATWRRTSPDRARLALVLGATPALLLAFGVIPPEWIIQIPFVANIAHIDNTFSCILIVHLIVLAGLGIRTAAERLRGPEARGDIFAASAIGAVPILLWLALTQTVHREPMGPNTFKKFLHWGEHVPVTPFVWFSLIALTLALLGLTLIWWRTQRRGHWTAASSIFALTCLGVLLWRHGQHSRTNFDRYVYNPAVRVNFHARSSAIEFIRAHAGQVRTVGLGANLFPGWSGVYDVESTSGPDAVTSGLYRELTSGGGLERMWDWAVLPTVANLPRERAFYDFLNVRYYLDLRHDPAVFAPILELEFAGDLNVYSSPAVWPRAFFTDRVAPYGSAGDLGQMILHGDGRPFAAMQQSDPDMPPGLDHALTDRIVAPVTDWELTTNTTSFTVQASSPGLVVLHENWFAGDFRVTIDDRPAKCLRVNHAFKGVAVPAAGEYRMTFAYWPRHFSIALALAAGGIGLFVAMLVWGWRSRPVAP